MPKYTLEKALQFDSGFGYYKGDWKLGRTQVPLTVTPPRMPDYLMRAEDCLRGLKKDWKTFWKRVVERCHEELAGCGRIEVGTKIPEQSIAIGNFDVFMDYDGEMCFSVHLCIKGLLSDDELVDVSGDFKGTWLSSELYCTE